MPPICNHDSQDLVMSYNRINLERTSSGRFSRVRALVAPWAEDPTHPHWDEKTMVVMSHIFSRATIDEWEMASETVIDTPIPEDRYWCAVGLFEIITGEKWEKNGLDIREFVHI